MTTETVQLAAMIDGKPVPLALCSWVLWAPCGCCVGVTVAALPGIPETVKATEDAAWWSLTDTKAEAKQMKKRGYRMEFMTNERWRADVSPAMVYPCPHKTKEASE